MGGKAEEPALDHPGQIRYNRRMELHATHLKPAPPIPKAGGRARGATRRRERRLPMARPAEPDLLQCLNAMLRDERWRAVIRDRLIQGELAEIQF